MFEAMRFVLPAASRETTRLRWYIKHVRKVIEQEPGKQFDAPSRLLENALPIIGRSRISTNLLAKLAVAKFLSYHVEPISFSKAWSMSFLTHNSISMCRWAPDIVL